MIKTEDKNPGGERVKVRAPGHYDGGLVKGAEKATHRALLIYEYRVVFAPQGLLPPSVHQHVALIYIWPGKKGSLENMAS